MSNNDGMRSGQGGGNRTIIYIVVAVVVLGIIYFAARNYWAPAPTPPVAEEPAPAPAPAPEPAPAPAPEPAPAPAPEPAPAPAPEPAPRQHRNRRPLPNPLRRQNRHRRLNRSEPVAEAADDYRPARPIGRGVFRWDRAGNELLRARRCQRPLTLKRLFPANSFRPSPATESGHGRQAVSHRSDRQHTLIGFAARPTSPAAPSTARRNSSIRASR